MIVEDFLILFLGGFSFHLMGLQYSHSFIHLQMVNYASHICRYLSCVMEAAVHYLCLKTGRILEHVEQFRVVDLQQHSCDLACPLTVLALRENMCKSDKTQLGENKCDLR